MQEKATRARIGVRNVEALKPHPDGGTRVRLWDTVVKGFAVRVSANWRKTYIVKYERRGKDQTFTIGEHGSPWTPSAARERAKEVLAQVSAGVDPAEKKREDRSAITVSDLIELWLRDGPISRPNKRAWSWTTDGSRLRRHAKPIIGRLMAREVRRRDIEFMQAEIARGVTVDRAKRKGKGRVRMSGGPLVAGNVVQCVSAMYGWGIDMEYVEHNPCMRVKRATRPKRVRFLSRDETQRLLKAISEVEAEGYSRAHLDIIRLLLLTGARKSEISKLKWHEVDWDRCCILLPIERSKTGERDPIRLAKPAIAILRAWYDRRDISNPLAFPSTNRVGKPSSAPDVTWKVVRARAGLENFRLHDLRHNAASVAVNEGLSLFLTGKLLGHKSSVTTERYAHAADDPVHRAAEAVASRILANAQPKPEAPRSRALPLSAVITVSVQPAASLSYHGMIRSES